MTTVNSTEMAKMNLLYYRIYMIFHSNIGYMFYNRDDLWKDTDPPPEITPAALEAEQEFIEELS